MAFTRRATNKDATWARAWTADTHDDLALINAIGGTEGPRHGDVAFVISEGAYYWWQDDGTWLNPSSSGGTGDVVGPASATDNAVALYDGTTGKLIKNSTLTPTNIQTKPILITDLPSNVATKPVSLVTDVTGDLPFANLAQGSALSVLGVTGNATADNASIVAASDGQVVRRSGTAVGFGAVNLASANAVTGVLPIGNLPANVATKPVPAGDLPANVAYRNIDNTFSVPQTLPPGTSVTGANTHLYFNEPGSPVDEKIWRIIMYSGSPFLRFEALNDAINTLVTAFYMARNGDFYCGRDVVVPRGVSFPITQIPVAASNILDDYREGTWTPVLNFDGGTTGITYASQTGEIIKIGRFVFASFRIELTSKGSSAGAAFISGLPYFASSVGYGILAGSGSFINLVGITGALGGVVLINDAKAILQQSNNSTGVVNLNHTNFSNSSILIAAFAYISAS
jgi:hypothetical protein